MNIFLLALILILGMSFRRVNAGVYLSQPQAIQTAFPAASKIERKTVFLTDAQTKQIESLARAKLTSAIVSYYVARSSAGVTGIAFFDKRIVRTAPITYMVAVQPSGAVDHIDILSMEEPEDYLPPPRWLALYRSRVLNQDLTVGRDIPHITGASLSSQAMNDGIRVILATYQVAVKDTL